MTLHDETIKKFKEEMGKEKEKGELIQSMTRDMDRIEKFLCSEFVRRLEREGFKREEILFEMINPILRENTPVGKPAILFTINVRIKVYLGEATKVLDFVKDLPFQLVDDQAYLGDYLGGDRAFLFNDEKEFDEFFQYRCRKAFKGR